MKAAPGTHTFVATSPAREPRIVTVSPDGNQLHDGEYHGDWDEAGQRYRGRMPPNANPPGEWVF